jgi:glutamate racemase
MQNAPIGIFDSGLGGLTVAKAIDSLLPNEEIIYYGDTLHLPYGEKSQKHIQEYSEAIVRYLLSLNVKLIVIACNSASANAASYLREKFHKQIEIRGVIRPMLKAVAEKNFSTVGLIGTQATVNSGIYAEILKEYNAETKLESLATPLLVPMIEEGFNTNSISKEVIKEYLQQFKNIEALLLACTHYPLIKNSVEDFFEKKIVVMDNADYMAQDVQDFLLREKLLCQERKNENQFWVSDYTQNFAKSASMFFGKEINVQEHNIFAV